MHESYRDAADPDVRWTDGNSHNWLFAKPPRGVRDPKPCNLCYHPLDAWGCCDACERRAEREEES